MVRSARRSAASPTRASWRGSSARPACGRASSCTTRRARSRPFSGPEVWGGAGAEDDSRYRIAGEIAKGGVGIIYKARDADLGRDVALKVLRREHASNPEVLERLIEEAQIGGQLQHPGIVPVYGMGLQPDERPYFAMKLIKGRTLAAVLKDRKDPLRNLPRFLRLFEQVCQTMAYAHTRGVIHRDLKPSNIMVGSFGEVLVVDWGFGKVLGRHDPMAGKLQERTIVATVRSKGEGSESITGSVMGTPAYMPPEQALGQIETLDERCDVFALGAILCEIVTGRPPYVGAPEDLLTMAAQARLEGARERLSSSRADPALRAFCERCLAPMRADRPRDAGEVAEEVAAHLAAAEERAHRAAVAAAEAEEAARRARAEVAEQRRARRQTHLVAAGVLLAILAGAGSYLEWRPRALEWLRAQLAAWSALLPAGADEVRWNLQRWKGDLDLAGVRDRIDELPEAEREGWSRLWADVDATLARAAE